MNDLYHNTPDGRRAKRVEEERRDIARRKSEREKKRILRLEKARRKSEEIIRKNQEEVFLNLRNLYPKIISATDGKIGLMPLMIIRAIHISKSPQTFAALEKCWATTYSKISLLNKIKADPLTEEFKKWILQAVYDFDRPFLKSLISAMDLVEDDKKNGIHNPKVAKVIICHDSWERDHKRSPTNSELLDTLRARFPDTSMDERTLRDICKRYRLPLSPGKRGRLSINTEVKKNRLPN